MTLIHGAHLKEAWPDMSGETLGSVLQRICTMIKVFPNIQVGYPRPIGGGKNYGFHFIDFATRPFMTQKNLQDRLSSPPDVCKSVRQVPKDRPDVVESELVMCRVDLHPKNIIIASNKTPWLLDWRKSEAYPPLFEAANLRYTPGKYSTDQLYEQILELQL